MKITLILTTSYLYTYLFFCSYVLYGILGWSSAAKTANNAIQILQTKVLQIINNSTWKDRIVNDSLYCKHKILKISDISNFELSKFVYNYHVKSFPEIFETYLLPLAQAHNSNTRSKSNQNYFVNPVNTNSSTGRNSIQFHGVRKWNQIPSEIKSC